MELTDRIELRRFVGRELLLWLWFESELFEATLATKAHGTFGLWLEGRLVLNAGRESTVIRGSAPGRHREAKEALLVGKLPERAGLHLSYGDHEVTLTLRGEELAISGLTLPRPAAAAAAAGEETAAAALAPPAPPRKKKRKSDDEAFDEAHEDFYERMRLAREIEELVEALYRDFLTLRLGPAWDAFVRDAIAAWTAGEEVDDDAYRAARSKALARR
jgi:hypothetical protein